MKMKMKFNGLVLYSPTPEEVQLLRDILDIHLKTKPDMKEISKRNSKKKFFSTKYDYAAIGLEVKNLSLGWDWKAFKFGFDEITIYTEPKKWVDTLTEVAIMLSINTECYITPEQSRSILVALDEYNVMCNAES